MADVAKPPPHEEISKPKEGKTEDKKNKPVEDDLSDEDKQLQEELDMLVERLREPKVELYDPALQSLKSLITQSTTSMTSVPKPLKFLKRHIQAMKDVYEKIENPVTKKDCADIISVLGMTVSEGRECLKYKLMGTNGDIGEWGHEYVRHLAGEISHERWEEKTQAENRKPQLLSLAEKIIPYHLTHNAEAEACDLAMELEHLEILESIVTEDNRVCAYLASCVAFVPDPENMKLLQCALNIYQKFNQWPQALRTAMQLNNTELITEILKTCPDPIVQKQLAFMTGRQQILDVNPQDLGKKDGANADLYLQRKGKCAVTKTSKRPVRVHFSSYIDFEHDNAIDFPDDLAAGLALRNLDTAISSIIRIQKILKRIKKVDSGRRQFKVQTFRHKSSFWGKIELMMLLMLTISLVSCFAVYETEKQKFCEPSFDCLNCLANGCVFVEFANRSKLCALSFNKVKGLRRRQYSLSCPQDLVPKKIADWFSIKTKFIDDEYYGYKLYVWLTIPVIGLAVIFIGFKIVRCYYHKTRYNPRSNWKRPECLRDLCKGRHRDVRNRSPSIQMDTVHYDSVSDIMESEQITNSCSGSGVESLNSSDDSDSTYSPSSISSTESPIPSTTAVPYRVLRPRKAINYSED